MRDLQKVFEDIKRLPNVESQRVKLVVVDPICTALATLIDRLDQQHRVIMAMREDYVSLNERLKALEKAKTTKGSNGRPKKRAKKKTAN